MPSFETMRRVNNIKYNSAKTIGQIYKEESDWLMDETWFEDPQSKICYIYDYKHDDMPDKKSGMTYENTTKTKIDAKFIITSYGSITKDQVAYHLMFRPSQKLEFEECDELYYFETDYRQRYDVTFPCGLFIDIPNEKGVYEKWLIINEEQGNQFIKYNILPVNYLFEWIETDGENRYKRRMWGCERQQLSYDQGLWIDRYFQSMSNVEKAYLQLNPITENIFYLDGNSENQRMVISAKTKNPLVWKVSKVENTKPLGIVQLTFSQSVFDQHKDFIEKDENGNIIGMWADYYSSNIIPTDNNEEISTPSATITGTISSTTYSIKVGGSYKTLSLALYDDNGNDVANKFSNATFKWSCSVENEDLTDIVTWLNCDDIYKQKIKFPNNRNYLGKILTITCTIIDEHVGYLYAHKEFELII